MEKAITIFAAFFGSIMKTVFSPIVVLRRGKLCITAFYGLGALQAIGLYVGFYLEFYLLLAAVAFLADEFAYIYDGSAEATYKPIYWAMKGLWWWAGFYYLWFVLWR